MRRRAVIRSRTGARLAAAIAAAGIALAAGAAHAGTPSGNPLDGSSFEVCGKWILKMRDFGKRKVNDYNDYVPPNFQTVPGRLTPRMNFFFGIITGPGTWFMTVDYPDQMGVVSQLVVGGSYRQRGKKLNFEVDQAGLGNMALIYAQLAENSLFGDPDRQLVTDIPFSMVTNPNKLRFKGRLKKGGRHLKVKFKANLLYDIQFENESEFADVFNAKGRLKLRADSRKCPDVPPTP